MKKNIILIGFMGAGKTTMGIAFADRMDMTFVDTDQLIEKEQKRSISSIFETDGEAAFRKMETDTLKQLLQEENQVISAGGGLPILSENQQLLKKIGTTVYLKADKSTLADRLKGDTTRPLLREGNLEDRIETLMNQREHVYEAVADLVIITDGRNADEILAELEKHCFPKKCDAEIREKMRCRGS